MGKSTISMGIFNSYVCLPEGMCLCMIYYVSNRGFFYNQNHVPSGKQLFSQTYWKKQLCSPGFRSDPQPFKRFSSTHGWLKAVSWRITRESQTPCKNPRIKLRGVYPSETRSATQRRGLKDFLCDFNRVFRAHHVKAVLAQWQGWCRRCGRWLRWAAWSPQGCFCQKYLVVPLSHSCLGSVLPY